MAVAPSIPMAPINVLMLVMRMTPATAVPRMRAGRARTTKAANGAATMPPRRSAPTTDHGISAKLSARRNPRLAAQRDDELAGVNRADHLARLHAARGEQGGRGDGPPTATTRGVEETGYQPQRSQKTFRNGPLHYRLLPPPEREAGQDVNAEGEQEDGDHRRDQLLSDGRDPGHRDRAQERPDAARYRHPPDLGPVNVAKAPVRDPRRSAGPHLGKMHARRRERRRNPYRQQQRRRGHPIGHPQRSIHQLGGQTHYRQNDEAAHSTQTSLSLYFLRFSFFYEHCGSLALSSVGVNSGLAGQLWPPVIEFQQRYVYGPASLCLLIWLSKIQTCSGVWYGSNGTFNAYRRFSGSGRVWILTPKLV